MTTKYRLIRLPSTQEDAGREFLIGTYATKEETEKIRDEHVASSKGYFSHHCFTIVEAPPPAPWRPGSSTNCKISGWEAYFAGRPRSPHPFPPARYDLKDGFEEGWDLAAIQSAAPKPRDPEPDRREQFLALLPTLREIAECEVGPDLVTFHRWRDIIKKWIRP